MKNDEQVKPVVEKLKAWLKREELEECTVSDAAQLLFGIKDPNQAELRMLGQSFVACGWKRTRRSGEEGRQYWTYVPEEKKNRLVVNRLLPSDS